MSVDRNPVGDGLPVARRYHPAWREIWVPASMVSRPTSSATYMYQRRSVADVPSSPTAARSRHAIQKCKPQTAAKTTAAHPACAADRYVKGGTSRTVTSSWPSAMLIATIAATELTRQAQ